MKTKGKIILLSLAIVPFFIYGTYKITQTQDDFEVAKNLELYHSAVKNIRQYYVDDVDAAGMINESIYEFLNKLDPYTVFFSESTIETYEFMQTGSYAGIGVSVVNRENQLFVTDIYANSPAEKAGLKPGDYIVSVDGRELTDENISVVENMLQGAVDSEVKLGIYRPFEGTETRYYTLTRKRIQDKAVAYTTSVDEKTAYIRFSIFTQHSGKEFSDALQAFDTANLDALIIDLRNNPGGFLQEAVNILDLFIAKNKVLVSTRGRLAQWNSVFQSKHDPIFPELKIVVIVNNSSASASEIVAGAFQDYDRAVIIGERTYGKGLVQITKDLGYNSKIKITTAKYYLPGGRCVQEIDYKNLRDGETPDSLKKAFTTQNGRIFYEGGGVAPDVSVTAAQDRKFIRYLINHFVIHDYVTKYVSEHPAENSENITFTDFHDFKQFALSHLNSYKPLQKTLEEISEDPLFEDFELSEDLLSLQTKAKNHFPGLLEKYKDPIISEIKKELYLRRFGKAKQLKYIIQRDPVLARAKEILKDEKQYREILGFGE